MNGFSEAFTGAIAGVRHHWGATLVLWVEQLRAIGYRNQGSPSFVCCALVGKASEANTGSERFLVVWLLQLCLSPIVFGVHLLDCISSRIPCIERMNEALTNWQRGHGFTYEQAAQALGLGRTMFWKYLRRDQLPRLIGLACQGVTIGQCVRDVSVWHKRHNHTYVTAALALGVSRAAYAKYLRARFDQVPKPVLLACAALDEGLEPIDAPTQVLSAEKA